MPFVLFDRTGRVVPSSLVMRSKKPVNGTFRAVADPNNGPCCLIPFTTELQNLAPASNLELSRLTYSVRDSNNTTWVISDWLNSSPINLPAGTYILTICRTSLSAFPLIQFSVDFNSISGGISFNAPATVDCVTQTISVIEPFVLLALRAENTP